MKTLIKTNSNFTPSSVMKTLLLASITATALTACNSLPHASSSSSNQSAASHTVSKADNKQFPADDSRHEYQLDNGLKVIIKEDHRAPVAMTQIWYSVGSTDEPEDKGGTSIC